MNVIEQPDQFLVHQELDRKIFNPPHTRVRSLIIAQPDELTISTSYVYKINWLLILYLVIPGVCAAFLGLRNPEAAGLLGYLGIIFTVVVPPFVLMVMNRKRDAEEVSLTLSLHELKLLYKAPDLDQPDLQKIVRDVFLPLSSIQDVRVVRSSKGLANELSHEHQDAPHIVFLDSVGQKYVFASKAFAQHKGFPFMPGYTAHRELEWMADIIRTFLQHARRTAPAPEDSARQLPNHENFMLEPAQTQQVQQLIDQPPLTKHSTRITLEKDHLAVETTFSQQLGWSKYIVAYLGFLIYELLVFWFGIGSQFLTIPFFFIFMPLIFIVELGNCIIDKTHLIIHPDTTTIIRRQAPNPRGPWETTQQLKIPTRTIQSCSLRQIRRKPSPSRNAATTDYGRIFDHVIDFKTTTGKTYSLGSPVFVTTEVLESSDENQQPLKGPPEELAWIYDVVSTYHAQLPSPPDNALTAQNSPTTAFAPSDL